MVTESLQRLEHLLLEHIGPADLPSLAGAAKQLSDGFTRGRATLAAGYLDDPRRRLAYLAHFVLTNAAKVLHGLGEADGLGRIPDKRAFRVLDLGCGPGTASLAASLFLAQRFPGADVEMTGVETSGAALEDAAHLLAGLGAPGHRFVPALGALDAATLPQGRFDIVIAANVLNELGEDDAAALCRALAERHLEPDGFLLVVDPALRATTRSLMRLRDHLVSAGLGAFAPCLHGRPCPMLAANERDWCHFYIEWERPKLIERMDALTGLDHRLLKMAYMMVAKRDASRGAERDAWRAVSSPLVSKGKREVVLCGANGELVRMMRQDKYAAEPNRAFDDVRRGDVVVCACDRKITATDSFTIRRRWQ